MVFLKSHNHFATFGKIEIKNFHFQQMYAFPCGKTLRVKPSLSINMLLNELEAYIDTTGWRHTYESFKFSGKSKVSVNEVSIETHNQIKKL